MNEPLRDGLRPKSSIWRADAEATIHADKFAMHPQANGKMRKGIDMTEGGLCICSCEHEMLNNNRLVSKIMMYVMVGRMKREVGWIHTDNNNNNAKINSYTIKSSIRGSRYN